MKKTILEGRAVIINDNDGKLIENIDTDMIFHNKHLHITKLEEMGPHAFGNLDDWTDFPNTTQKDDILIVGGNFGCGSSRQQAVDCFTALGVQAIVGESFGAIYYRNAVNAGVPIIRAKGIEGADIAHGDMIRLNIETGEIENITKSKKVLDAEPFSRVQMDIYQSGSIFEYAKSL